MKPTKLTTRLLDSLKPGARVRDTAVRGLFVEVGEGGTVRFKFQADARLGPKTGEAREAKTVRRTFGAYPDELSLDAARDKAMALRLEIRAGRIPDDIPKPQRVVARARPAKSDKAAPASTNWTVAEAFEKYIDDIEKRPGSDLTRRDMRNHLDRYLEDWKDLPLASLHREMCEARQKQIVETIKKNARSPRYTGAKSANATIKDIATVWAFAEDFIPLPRNPCKKVRLYGEVKHHHEIALRDLGTWYAKLKKLRSPLRRAMHELGLLSALRPGNLMQIQRAWIHLDELRIVFPKEVMKGRVQFVLPLSQRMVEVIRAALAAGDILEPGSPHLFPSRDEEGNLISTVVVREKSLPNATGNALRHTWKTCARNARLQEVSIELLMAHSLGRMQKAYGNIEEQFERYQEEQERVTAYILDKIKTTAPKLAA